MSEPHNLNSGTIAGGGKDLRDRDGRLPEGVEEPMTALQFARMMSPPSISFGLRTRDEVVAQLREIIARMENPEHNHKIVLQEAHSSQSAWNDDFLRSTIVLHFVEFLPSARTGTRLYGAAQFPVDIKG